jgi:hypothetical protein
VTCSWAERERFAISLLPLQKTLKCGADFLSGGSAAANAFFFAFSVEKEHGCASKAVAEMMGFSIPPTNNHGFRQAKNRLADGVQSCIVSSDILPGPRWQVAESKNATRFRTLSLELSNTLLEMQHSLLSALLVGAAVTTACVPPTDTLSNTITTQSRILIQNPAFPIIHDRYMNLLPAGGGDQHLFLSPVANPTFNLVLNAGALAQGIIHAVIGGEVNLLSQLAIILTNSPSSTLKLTTRPRCL